MALPDTELARKLAQEEYLVSLPDEPTEDVSEKIIENVSLEVLRRNVFEVLDLLGLGLRVKGEPALGSVTSISLTGDPKVNLVEIADGTSDIVVVSKGTQATYGFSESWGMLEDMAMVQKYMDVVCKQTIRTTPSNVTVKERLLRGSLIAEESLELLMLGFGYSLTMTGQDVVVLEPSRIKDIETFLVEENKHVNLDALGDILRNINIHAKMVDALFGIPSDEVILEEVMRSNLDKIWDDGTAHFRESDGKNIKPPNHQPPNIARVLDKHRQH